MSLMDIEQFTLLSKGKKLEALFGKLNYFNIPKLSTITIKKLTKLV